jgi:hypothetical protein
MGNYFNLKELYACLIDPTYIGGKKINITATADRLSPCKF